MIINPQIRSKEWADLVQSSKFASFFQTEQAYNFYASQSYLDTFAIGVVEEEILLGVVVGYIQSEPGLLSPFSKRAIVLGGPLLSPIISSSALTELLKALQQRTKRAIYLEIRNSHDYSEYKNQFFECGFQYQPHHNILIHCDNYPSMLERMDENRRRVLSKPLPNSYQWQYASTDEDIIGFYKLLKKHYQVKVRKPLFPIAFFLDMVHQGVGRILLLLDETRIIGGMLQVVLPNQIVYDYYVCALDQEYKSISPSVQIYAKSLQETINIQCSIFDTMGAGVPGEDYGVRDFKLRFGGDLVEYGRYVSVHKRSLYQLGKCGISLLQKLK